MERRPELDLFSENPAMPADELRLVLHLGEHSFVLNMFIYPVKYFGILQRKALDIAKSGQRKKRAVTVLCFKGKFNRQGAFFFATRI